MSLSNLAFFKSNIQMHSQINPNTLKLKNERIGPYLQSRISETMENKNNNTRNRILKGFFDWKKTMKNNNKRSNITKNNIRQTMINNNHRIGKGKNNKKSNKKKSNKKKSNKKN